jgi:hypothetical protein
LEFGISFLLLQSPNKKLESNESLRVEIFIRSNKIIHQGHSSCGLLINAMDFEKVSRRRIGFSPIAGHPEI